MNNPGISKPVAEPNPDGKAANRRTSESQDRNRRVSTPRKFLSGAGLSLGGLLVSGVLTFLTRRCLARSLDTAAYGFLYGVLALMAPCVAAVGSGLGEATSVLVAKYFRLGDEARGRSLFRHVFALRVGVSLLASAALAAAGPWFWNRYFRFPAGRPVFLILCLWPPLTSALWAVMAALSGRLDFSAQILFDLAHWALLAILVVLTVPVHGMSAAALAMVLAPAIMIPFAVGYAWRRHGMSLRFGRIQGSVVKEVWRFSRWSVLIVVGTSLLASLDTLILARIAGLRSAGIYQVAVPITQVFRALMVLPGLFLPVASDLWHGQRRRDIAALCRFTVRSVAVYGWTLWILLFAASDVVIGALFGSQFEEAATPLLILGAGVPLLVIAVFFLNILSSMGHPEKAARRIWIAVALDVALNLALARRWGAPGAASASALAYAALLLMARHGLRARVPVRLLEPATMRAGLVGAVCCAGAAVAGETLSGGAAVAAGLVAALLFVAMEQRLIVTLWYQGRRLAQRTE